MITVDDVRQMVSQALAAAKSHPFFVSKPQMAVLEEVQARLAQDAAFTVQDVAAGASQR